MIQQVSTDIPLYVAQLTTVTVLEIQGFFTE